MRQLSTHRRATRVKAFLLMAFLAVAGASFFPADALRVIGDCETGPVTCHIIDDWTGQVVGEGFMMIVLY